MRKRIGPEATPQGGDEASPSRCDPYLARGSPEFASLCHQSCSEHHRIWTKLGRNDLLAKPDKMTRPLFLLATRGLSYLTRKVKFYTFHPFSSDFDSIIGSKGGKRSLEVAEGLLGTAWGSTL